MATTTLKTQSTLMEDSVQVFYKGSWSIPQSLYGAGPYSQNIEKHVRTENTTSGLLPVVHNGKTVYVPRFRFLEHRSFKRSFYIGSVPKIEFIYNKTPYRYINCGSLLTSLHNYLRDGLDVKLAANGFPSILTSAYGSHSYSLNKISELLKSDSSLLGLPTVNLLASIAELADLKKLPKLLTSWKKNDLDISDKFLGVSFGVLPIISDIKNSIQIAKKSGPAIDRWNSFAMLNKVLNGHSSFKPNVPYPITFDESKRCWLASGSYQTTVGGPTNPQPTYFRVTHSFKREIRCKASVYYIPKIIDGDHFEDLWRNLYGLDGLIETAWELIPYSFVVDWFTNLGDNITKFANSGRMLEMTLVNAGYSWSSTTEHTLSIEWVIPDYGTVQFGVYRSIERSYLRRPVPLEDIFLANTKYSLEFSRPSTSQTVLGSALLHQLLR